MMMSLPSTANPNVSTIGRSGLIPPRNAEASPTAQEGTDAQGKHASGSPSQNTSLYNHPKKDIYTYERASLEFNQTKKAHPETYKQFLVQDTDIMAEQVSSGNQSFTRYNTGTLVKQATNKSDTPLYITSQNGLVLQSDLIKPQDIEQELSDVTRAVNELPNPDTSLGSRQKMIEQQVTKDVVEAEIWGQTMSNPDHVKINSKTDDIDIDTPTGTFHLDKQDNISFDRLDGMQLKLEQVVPQPLHPDAEKDSDTSEKNEQDAPPQSEAATK
jgi:hypothetical protein